ncbi:MAG: peptide-methionine (S)-S-oxide reductase MsrA [Burkholderiales bacterium]
MRALFVALWLCVFPAAAQNTPAVPPGHAVATFAGGCFWCMEPPYDKIDGVISTTSGYLGGKTRFPTYEQVSSGSTGHTEVVRVIYDPRKVGFRTLLEIFWKNIDPVARDRQFCDGGTMYRSGVYWHDDEQKKLIEESKALLNRGQAFGSARPVGFKGGVVTETGPAPDFWPAEDYHQDYYLKNPVRYNYYRTGCGRDARLKQLWGESK